MTKIEPFKGLQLDVGSSPALSATISPVTLESVDSITSDDSVPGSSPNPGQRLTRLRSMSVPAISRSTEKSQNKAPGNTIIGGTPTNSVKRKPNHRESIMQWETAGITVQEKKLPTLGQNLFGEAEDEQDTVGVHLFHPLKSFRTRWDLLTMLLLVYTGVVTPTAISFYESTATIDFYFVIDRAVDLFFVIDIFFNFFTMYYSSTKHAYVTNRTAVALHYARTWFFIDLVSVIPFDLLAISFGDRLSSLQLLRNMKLLKLVKLARVLRIGRIVRRWESRLGVRFGVIRLYKFFAMILVVAHWSACLWHLVAVTEETNDPEVVTWLQRVRDPDGKGVFPKLSVFDRYSVSFYWSVMTLTTIGYGDITPTTTIERWVSIVTQLLGACVFAYIVGNITTLVASLNRNQEVYQQKMDGLNEYIENQRLPQDLKMRLRDYFSCALRHTTTYDAVLLHQMSPTLRGEVVAWTFKDKISKIPLFQGTDIDFITAVAVNFKPETFAPEEYFFREGDPCDKLYLVNMGTAQMLSSTGAAVHSLREGSVFGEDMLLVKHRRCSVKAATYVNVSAILNSALASVLERRPEILRRMKAMYGRRLWKKGYYKAKAVNSIFRSIKLERELSGLVVEDLTEDQADHSDLSEEEAIKLAELDSQQEPALESVEEEELPFLHPNPARVENAVTLDSLASELALLRRDLHIGPHATNRRGSTDAHQLARGSLRDDSVACGSQHARAGSESASLPPTGDPSGGGICDPVVTKTQAGRGPAASALEGRVQSLQHDVTALRESQAHMQRQLTRILELLEKGQT